MINRKRGFVILMVALPLVGSFVTAPAHARSFEECQAYAISLGIPASRTGRIDKRYLRYKAAGTAIHPRGVVARCMAGTS